MLIVSLSKLKKNHKICAYTCRRWYTFHTVAITDD